MIKITETIRQGRDAFIAHKFAGRCLLNPYNRGTRHAFWWGRGVVMAEQKISELMEIGL